MTCTKWTIVFCNGGLHIEFNDVQNFFNQGEIILSTRVFLDNISKKRFLFNVQNIDWYVYCNGDDETLHIGDFIFVVRVANPNFESRIWRHGVTKPVTRRHIEWLLEEPLPKNN